MVSTENRIIPAHFLSCILYCDHMHSDLFGSCSSRRTANIVSLSYCITTAFSWSVARVDQTKDWRLPKYICSRQGYSFANNSMHNTPELCTTELMVVGMQHGEQVRAKWGQRTWNPCKCSMCVDLGGTTMHAPHLSLSWCSAVRCFCAKLFAISLSAPLPPARSQRALAKSHNQRKKNCCSENLIWSMAYFSPQ